MAEVPIAEAAPYAAADAVMTLRLAPLLEADLQDHGVEELNRDIEVKLIPHPGRHGRGWHPPGPGAL